MYATIETLDASIIVIGDFNPVVISPDWLERNNFIGKDDAEDARNDDGTVISRKVTQFETSWFAL